MRRRPYWLVLILTVAITPLLALPVGADTSEQAASRFLTGPNEGDPADIALTYFQTEAETYGLTASDVAELSVRSSYVTRHNGATHVNINQQFDGLEVFGAETSITIAADGSVAFVGGSAVGNLAVASSAGTDLAAADAVEAAAAALDLDEPQDVRTMRRRGGPARETVLTDGGISDEPIPARLGWQPTDDGLRLAWQLVIDDATDAHLWNATIDASTGDLLEVDDWTSENSIDDLIERLGRGGGSSNALATATSTTAGPIVTPNPVDDGSSYRVYGLPIESPTDGGRSLISNPADADASPFGWHDTDGVAGPEFTITRGNNVHAYTDHNNSNNPTQTGTSTFVVDPPSSAAGEYSHTGAAFGPTATPANFDGDIVLVDDGSGDPTLGCEPFTVPDGAIALVDRGECPFVQKVGNAQDGGASAVIVANNAPGNPITMGGSDASITIPSIMISLADGDSIKAGLPATGRIHLIPPTAPSEPDGGPSLMFDFALDLNDHPHDYAEAATTNLFYWCNVAHDVFWHFGFDEASGNFQVNNYGRGGVGGDDVRCEAQDGGGINNANFSTPAADGDRPRMQMYLWNTADPFRDGDLESGIVLHEYSHGVSNRLTGGPGVNCLGGTQRMGEGWSDYHGIVTLIDPALDDPEGPRGMGTYALNQDDPPRQGAGIRPRPYSRNMDIQPFTYESISSGGWLNGATLAAPHHIGHGWASILWDMTWDLIDKHGFNPNVYESWDTGGNILSQYLVMDGLKIQGCNPGFVDGRDAILTADELLTGGDNACTLWASFARRGLGFSAVQDPGLGRNGNVDGFDTHPDCLEGLSPPVNAPYGDLNTKTAGDTVPLRFDLGSNQGLDILASNSPYSRQVDCDTLDVVQEGEFITPKARPVATETPGGSGLSVSGRGVYTYPWETLEEWAGTCRELVLTRSDGVQHRAFFEFTAD